MIRSFRYQMLSAAGNLGAYLIFAAVVTAGYVLVDASRGESGFFTTYFSMFPFMGLLLLFIFGYGMCTLTLSTALSFGDRRRTYFWALQGAVAAHAAAAWLVSAAMSLLPARILPQDATVLTPLLTGLQSLALSPAFPMLVWAVMCFGCVVGLLTQRSRVVGTVVMVAAMLIGLIGGTAALIMQDEWSGAGRPGVNLTLAAVCLIIIALSEAFLWRSIRRHVVK